MASSVGYWPAGVVGQVGGGPGGVASQVVGGQWIFGVKNFLLQ